jgi:hypothetical protein
VVKTHGQLCGDIELTGYSANATDPVPLVLDLRLSYDRFDSSSNPTLNRRLHYNDIDKSLNEDDNDKIRKYRSDCNNNPPNSVTFIPTIGGTNGRLHSDFIRLLFLQDHRETDLLFTSSGVQSAQSNLGATYFSFHRVTVLNQLKSKCGLILAKTVVLRVTLNLDGAPITSNSHTHPSHSQTSRLLTSSLSLGVPTPRPTQSMRDE